MEHGLLVEMRKRIIDDFLDIIILRELGGGSLGCHGVISRVHDRHDRQLSSGKTYSRLYSLEKKGLVQSRLNSNKRVFTLTDSGRDFLKEIQNEKNRILGYVLNIVECE